MSHAAWLEQAESDLEAARLLSGAGHHSQAVWLAAQAIEKAHKAILFALGLRYAEPELKRMNHAITNVAQLLPASLHEPTDPAIAEAVEALQKVALIARYPQPAKLVRPAVTPAPPVAPAVAIVSSQQELADAELLLAWCKSRVERALRAFEAMKP
jgi:HEPN domain-containing protein